MNCPNCGAAMRVVDRRDYFACDYCATFHFPQATDSSGRVTVLGEQQERDCPVCSAALVSARVAKVPAEYCRSCRGVLMTNGDFRTLVNALRTAHRGEKARPQALDPAEYERDIRCPGCEKPMDTHPYYGPGNVVVDTCPRCFLIWLDHGELEIIERA